MQKKSEKRKEDLVHGMRICTENCVVRDNMTTY